MLLFYHNACADESTNSTDKHHQFWVKYGVSVGPLVVSKVVTNNSNDDAVENELEKPDHHLNSNRYLWE